MSFLQKSVEDAVREKVLKQPAVARKNLKDLIHRRQEELRKVDSELETLEKELKALSSVVSHPQS
jgi:Skp family chaperone for outer membrane proteins